MEREEEMERGKEGRKKRSKPVLCYEDSLGRGHGGPSVAVEELEVGRWGFGGATDMPVRASGAWRVGGKQKGGTQDDQENEGAINRNKTTRRRSRMAGKGNKRTIFFSLWTLEVSGASQSCPICMERKLRKELGMQNTGCRGIRREDPVVTVGVGEIAGLGREKTRGPGAEARGMPAPREGNKQVLETQKGNREVQPALPRGRFKGEVISRTRCFRGPVG